MNFRIFPFIVLCSALWLSCSKDDDAVPKAKLNHTGEKWKITSVNYTIVDQNLSDPTQWVKTGTATNAGTFYLNGSEGSFDILIKNKREEDYFGYTLNDSDISIITVDQTVSATKFSQSVIAMSGVMTGSTITLNGTFTKQGLVQQYVFTGSFVLTKE